MGSGSVCGAAVWLSSSVGSGSAAVWLSSSWGTSLVSASLSLGSGISSSLLSSSRGGVVAVSCVGVSLCSGPVASSPPSDLSISSWGFGVVTSSSLGFLISSLVAASSCLDSVRTSSLALSISSGLGELGSATGMLAGVSPRSAPVSWFVTALIPAVMAPKPLVFGFSSNVGRISVATFPELKVPSRIERVVSRLS